jgi:hypothetical protein
LQDAGRARNPVHKIKKDQRDKNRQFSSLDGRSKSQEKGATQTEKDRSYQELRVARYYQGDCATQGGQ